MHLFSQSGNKLDDNEKSNMMKGLKKSIAKEISEKGLYLIMGKQYMSFKWYQKTSQHLIENSSVDSVLHCIF